MAQRTGAERFLASLAKTASARVTLALAAAALALAGCGGSSEEETPTASTPTSTAAAGAADSPAGANEGAEAKAGERAAKAAAGNAQGAAQGAGAQKQGPRIAQPTGKREQAPTPQEVAEATVADISLQSPALSADQEGPAALPATYTCDGRGTWPELRWAGVPSDTQELILYAMSVQPVAGQLFANWALAGIDPELEGIEAGKLPKGAIVGTNGYGKRGYEICPAEAEIYMFALYALPQRLAPAKGFDARELRRRILDASGNVGLLPVAYRRG